MSASLTTSTELPLVKRTRGAKEVNFLLSSAAECSRAVVAMKFVNVGVAVVDPVEVLLARRSERRTFCPILPVRVSGLELADVYWIRETHRNQALRGSSSFRGRRG